MAAIILYTLWVLITCFFKLSAGDNFSKIKSCILTCVMILVLPGFFAFLLYGNMGVYYAINGCGEDKVYNLGDCPVYIADFDNYCYQLMWATIIAELVTGPVALTNAVGYRKIMSASIELAQSNVRLNSNARKRAKEIAKSFFANLQQTITRRKHLS